MLISDLLAAYESGKSTRQISCEIGLNVSTVYTKLKKSGCVFRKPANEKTRAKMREAKACHFNGINGYGHTKEDHRYGYVLAYVPEHPRARSDGYVPLHTVVVEQSIGRYLNDNEVVHHINHKRNDNRIENLVLMDKHEHRCMHMRERWSKGSIRRNNNG